MKERPLSSITIQDWIRYRMLEEPEIEKEYGIYYAKPDERMIIKNYQIAFADYQDQQIEDTKKWNKYMSWLKSQQEAQI